MRRKPLVVGLLVSVIAALVTTAVSYAQSAVIIRGDLFAKQTIGSVTLAGPSVVTAGATANIGGSPTILTNYTPAAPNSFTQIQTNIEQSVTRIEKERGRQLAQSSIPPAGCTTMNLNAPPGADPFIGSSCGGNFVNDVFRPEGSLWIHNGDLTIDTMTVIHRGTIVVRGNATVTGNITYGTSGTVRNNSFGLIVLGGDLTFTNGAQQTVGAYFATGQITVQ